MRPWNQGGKRAAAWVVAALVAGIFVIYLFTVRWQPETQVRMKQMALVKAIEDGNGKRLAALLSDGYEDQWEFSKKDALKNLKDSLKDGDVEVQTPDILR